MTKRETYLDFIRVMAILLIVIYHYNSVSLFWNLADKPIIWESSSTVWNYTMLADMGISLFIILSGASLILSQRTNFGVKTFFKKRLLAIYPLFWFAYIASFSLLFLIHRQPGAGANPATFLLTLIGMDGFLLYKINNFYLLGEWFLGFIIIMYLLFPLLRYLFLKQELITFLFCLFIMLAVQKFYCFDMAIERFPLSRLLEFAFGMSFAYHFRELSKSLKYALMGTALLLFSLTLLFNLPALATISIRGMAVFTWLACVYDILPTSTLEKIIMPASAYSYGVFLFHHVLINQVFQSFFMDKHLSHARHYFLFLVLLPVLFLLSFLSTRLVSFILKKIAPIQQKSNLGAF